MTNKNLINQIIAEQTRQNVLVMSGAHLRSGVNDAMANVHHATNSQQAHHIQSASPRKPEPESPIPSPPFIPLQPKPIKGDYKYGINDEMLKSMSKQLRKPDGNNIRKIRKPKNMIISTKVTKTDEEDACMQPPTLPSSVLTSESPALPSEQVTPSLAEVDPESPVVLPAQP